jgi:hypothetical protein
VSKALVEKQIDDLLLIFREPLNGGMEITPTKWV